MKIDKMLHEAHLRYQRQQLRGDAVSLPSSEVRGVKRRRTKSEIESYAQQFRPEWFTHLRPNFWRAYFETLMYCKTH